MERIVEKTYEYDLISVNMPIDKMDEKCPMLVVSRFESTVDSRFSRLSNEIVSAKGHLTSYGYRVVEFSKGRPRA